jgi:endonuclease/exonuclease/phosphatase family metal-dependent hydrolase
MTTTHCVAFWNLENLFDIDTAPLARRPEKLAKKIKNELKGWDQEILDKKLARLAEIIGKINANQGPDILGVCEVENKHVLDLLNDQLAPLGRNYTVVHEDAKDARGIDVAFLIDTDKFDVAEVFAQFIVKRSSTRDLFQVNLKTKPAGRDLIVVGNHWPSRSGGRLESAPYRMLAGETLAFWHQRMRDEKGKNVAIIAMGDFNDEPFDRSLTDYARSFRSKAKVRNARSPTFYNLMWPPTGARTGSYYFNNRPNMLDQFMVSRGMILNGAPLRVVDGSVRIETFPEMTKSGQYPAPVRFGRPFKGGKKDNGFTATGFSDHFPISLELREK